MNFCFLSYPVYGNLWCKLSRWRQKDEGLWLEAASAILVWQRGTTLWGQPSQPKLLESPECAAHLKEIVSMQGTHTCSLFLPHFIETVYTRGCSQLPQDREASYFSLNHILPGSRHVAQCLTHKLSSFLMDWNFLFRPTSNGFRYIKPLPIHVQPFSAAPWTLFLSDSGLVESGKTESNYPQLVT